MWDRHFRTTLFIGIYEHLFWQDIDTDYVPDWYAIFGTYNPVTIEEGYVLDVDALDRGFALFVEHQQDYTVTLQQYLTDWSKTFNIVQAVLFTFLVELYTFLDGNKLHQNFVGKYIRLTQEMVGGENTALVHAVLSRIVTEMGIDIPVTSQSEELEA